LFAGRKTPVPIAEVDGMSDEPKIPQSHESSGKPNDAVLGWLTFLIPLVVVAVGFFGEGTRLFGGFSDGFLVCFWLLACGAGCVAALFAGRRGGISLTVSTLGLILNVAVALVTAFFYAMSHLWEGVKG
jgi:uncharacterized membrane protein